MTADRYKKGGPDHREGEFDLSADVSIPRAAVHPSRSRPGGFLIPTAETVPPAKSSAAMNHKVA
jgi:hypothetical protein